MPRTIPLKVPKVELSSDSEDDWERPLSLSSGDDDQIKKEAKEENWIEPNLPNFVYFTLVRHVLKFIYYVEPGLVSQS
jgi:hypothetical protein